MSKTVPYRKWRNKIEREIGSDARIADDLIILQRDKLFESVTTPIRTDTNTAVFLRSGTSRIRINMKEHVAKAPCMMILLADQTYQLIEYSDDTQVTAIVMSRRFSDELFREQGMIGALYKQVVHNPIVDLSRDASIFRAYYALLQNIIRSPHDRFRMEAAKHLTLSLFYGYSHIRHEVTATKPLSRAEQLFARFDDLLRHHYSHHRDIAFYAEQLCITPKHLSRIVKQVAGQTPLQYIEERVTTEAKALLASTDMTIEQIGERLHFPSQSVFGKYFKRVTHLSPRAYRTQTNIEFVTRSRDE